MAGGTRAGLALGASVLVELLGAKSSDVSKSRRFLHNILASTKTNTP